MKNGFSALNLKGLLLMPALDVQNRTALLPKEASNR
jgi:hypothetical protein